MVLCFLQDKRSRLDTQSTCLDLPLSKYHLCILSVQETAPDSNGLQCILSMLKHALVNKFLKGILWVSQIPLNKMNRLCSQDRLSTLLGYKYLLCTVWAQQLHQGINGQKDTFYRQVGHLHYRCLRGIS